MGRHMILLVGLDEGVGLLGRIAVGLEGFDRWDVDTLVEILMGYVMLAEIWVFAESRGY